MDAEVVAMCLQLYNAKLPSSAADPEGGAGTTTSGGTESILMACLAHRNRARQEFGITRPEMIVSASAHAAFDKASKMFGINIHFIPVEPDTRKVNLRLVKRAINANTILLVGSAPNFPDGIIDDIPGLSELAIKHNIGLHVDCCLGSFIVPYLEKCGFETQLFDFRVPGVTSISCDTHKYGFAPKGSSVVMYRSKSKLGNSTRPVRRPQPDQDGLLRRHPQVSILDHHHLAWRSLRQSLLGRVPVSSAPLPLYSITVADPSVTFARCRPGALLAGAWASMVHMGEDGYTQSCRDIVGSAKLLLAGLTTSFPELYVLGKPLASVVAFASHSLPIYEVGDIMSAKGWHLNALQNPPALHLACTKLTTPKVVEELLADLRVAVDEVRRNVGEGKTGKGSMVTLYGLGSSSAVGPGLVREMASRCKLSPARFCSLLVLTLVRMASDMDVLYA